MLTKASSIPVSLCLCHTHSIITRVTYQDICMQSCIGKSMSFSPPLPRHALAKSNPDASSLYIKKNFELPTLSPVMKVAGLLCTWTKWEAQPQMTAQEASCHKDASPNPRCTFMRPRRKPQPPEKQAGSFSHLASGTSTK